MHFTTALFPTGFPVNFNYEIPQTFPIFVRKYSLTNVTVSDHVFTSFLVHCFIFYTESFHFHFDYIFIVFPFSFFIRFYSHLFITLLPTLLQEVMLCFVAVSVFVCLSVCQQHYCKSNHSISLKLDVMTGPPIPIGKTY